MEGCDVEIRPGELSVTRPWERHSGQDNILGPGRLTWIILTASGRAEPVPRLHAPCLLHDLGDDAGWVLDTIATTAGSYLGTLHGAIPLFDLIHDELTDSRPGRQAVVRAACVSLLVLVARRLSDHDASGPAGRRASSEPVPKGVVSVLTMVAQQPQREWTSTAMAEAAGLGLTAFTEWCRRVTGRSPRWYVLEQRLALGRAMLASTDRSITHVALDSGFSSSQHFSATYRRLYGETPTAFRCRLETEGL